MPSILRALTAVCKAFPAGAPTFAISKLWNHGTFRVCIFYFDIYVKLY